MRYQKKRGLFSWLSKDPFKSDSVPDKAEADHDRTSTEEELNNLEVTRDKEAGPSDKEETGKLTISENSEQQIVLKKEGILSRLKNSLVKTRKSFDISSILFFRGKKIDEDLFEELEERLLLADIGIETTNYIINNLVRYADRAQLKSAEALHDVLRRKITDILLEVEQPIDTDCNSPFVILIVGVNGVGKTTTIGKLAHYYQKLGKSVMLAAGDTFRAAAVEQLQIWGKRNNVSVITQSSGTDSASVVFDAVKAAKEQDIDILIADTAGRLHNKVNLMTELKKVVRVMKKVDNSSPHEIMLVIDAGTGQNTIHQAKAFQETIGLTGLTLTKLDGTAKGGIIIPLAKQIGIPIRYVGIGEKIEDLKQFKAEEFVKALFS